MHVIKTAPAWALGMIAMGFVAAVGLSLAFMLGGGAAHSKPSAESAPAATTEGPAPYTCTFHMQSAVEVVAQKMDEGFTVDVPVGELFTVMQNEYGIDSPEYRSWATIGGMVTQEGMMSGVSGVWSLADNERELAKICRAGGGV